jgi:XPB/Ssl2-like helicase family protein
VTGNTISSLRPTILVGVATGGTLTKGLRELGKADLELLLARRPEALEALDGKGLRPTVSLLASALSGRPGIRRAVESLDLFLLQLVRVASWFGSEVPASTLLVQADGVAPEAVRAGAEELARWGLAFPHAVPDAAGGWGLSVPGCVRAEVPPALGRRIAELLTGEPVESVRSMLLRLGAEPPRPATRDSLVSLLTSLLSDPVALATILERAPAQARAVLDAFVEAGGTLTWEAMPRHGIRFGMPSGARDDSGVGVAWLRQVGLLVVTPPTSWQLGAGLSIPGEAQLALRGGVIFRGWDAAPPAVTSRPLPSASAAHAASAANGGAGDAASLLSAVQAILDEWTHRPPRAIQKGGAGVRELRKVAKAIGVDERHGQFLYALAVEAGLLEYRDDHLVPSPVADRWQRESSPEQWVSLFEAWAAASLWREPQGLVAIDEAHTAGPERQRTSVLEVLAELPTGEGAEPASIARLLWWRRPTQARSADGMQGFVAGVGEALGWLGTGAGLPLVALLDPGRSALVDPDWASSPGAAALFPEPVATLTVQPDLTILVPGRPAAGLSESLARFAELQASSPARIYRMSETSLRAALDGGMQPEEIVDVLEGHSRSPLPQSVRYLIADVGRRHGRLVAGRSGLFVRSEDPSIVAAVVADRRLARLNPRALAPTVAVFGEQDLDRLLKALRAAGYMPVAEPAAKSRPQARSEYEDAGLDVEIGLGRSRHTGGRPILYRHAGRRGRGRLGPGDIARIAAAVADDAARPPGAGPAPVADSLMDGRLCRAAKEIRRLVELGVQHSAVLEIQYLSGAGETTVREIEPVEADRSSVTARCRLRGDERTFWISRIRWARATGEHFEPDTVDVLYQYRRGRAR